MKAIMIVLFMRTNKIISYGMIMVRNVLFCLEIAAEAIKMTNDGSVKKIRSYIVDKYKQGYAAPTNTSMPL